METDKKLYTLDEIASYLQLSREKVTRLIKEKQFPAHKIDKQWRFFLHEVDSWVANRNSFDE